MHRIIESVSLKTIRSNALLIKERAQGKLIAVVKDDAYGHGAERVAHALTGIADLYAVSSVEEGASLRTAGVSEDILVLTPCLSEEEGARLVSYNLIASLSSVAALNLLKRAEERAGAKARAHLVINTGMNRYGVRPAAVSSLCRMAEGRVEGVYSHLFAPSDRRETARQVARFRAGKEAVLSFAPNALCHLSATGGALAGAERGAVRAGIALYGYLPEGFSGALQVKPAAKFYSFVSNRCRQYGGGTGYNKAQKRGVPLNTVAAGYGDGLFRAGGGEFEGLLCMDAGISEGDAKFGSVRRILKDVSIYAKRHGTTPYEVLVSVGSRAVHCYDSI